MPWLCPALGPLVLLPPLAQLPGHIIQRLRERDDRQIHRRLDHDAIGAKNRALPGWKMGQHALSLLDLDADEALIHELVDVNIGHFLPTHIAHAAERGIVHEPLLMQDKGRARRKDPPQRVDERYGEEAGADGAYRDRKAFRCIHEDILPRRTAPGRARWEAFCACLDTTLRNRNTNSSIPIHMTSRLTNL
ncbi:hypothetical protein WJ0W_004237 [Paenibacillus melissococcoides]|uniref:Secreted protein n=1 Tax=Paenibacillus melissococcoides TaxID=2912268 RepID=A0ABN8U760_9BACL|nr:hypothetical protein WJ0W_004237 [Paenibacillus melissococcoides]